MPLLDSNLQSTWDDLYSYNDPADNIVKRGFYRSGYNSIFGNNPDSLIDAMISLGLTAGQRVAIIGGAFGWVAERFIARGFGPAADGTANGKICVVDTSTWIHANKGNNAQLTITNADVNAATGRRTIRQQFGSNNAEVHWALSEDVLPLLIGAGPTPGGNNEIVPFCQSCRALVSVGTVHWISEGEPIGIGPPWTGDSRLNWKSLSEWKAWVTPDRVISRQTNQVL